MRNIIRVLVADRQTLSRKGICALLQGYRDIEIVGEASDGEEMFLKTKEAFPDIVLMDITLPLKEGANIITRLHRERETVKILLVSQDDDRKIVIQGLRTGSNGILPKSAYPCDLIAAIRALKSGDCFVPPSVARILIEDYLALQEREKSNLYCYFTKTERQVLKLITEGKKTSQIASMLNIARGDVLECRTNIMRKLHIHTVAGLVKYASNDLLEEPMPVFNGQD